jgi:hypothetical protein
MCAIFIFATEYDLSAAMTELRVAISLRWVAVGTGLLPARPCKIKIISTAAMHRLIAFLGTAAATWPLGFVAAWI